MEVGEAVAERHLRFRARNGRKRKVLLKIGRPIKGPERQDPWWCPIRIGSPIDEFFALAGEDSLQSLVLALSFVEQTLPSLARRKRGQIEWLSERERLVFSGTDTIARQWHALKNLTDGLAQAVAHFERDARSPKGLVHKLRSLVASHGLSSRFKR
jgi:hypothetical protein